MNLWMIRNAAISIACIATGVFLVAAVVVLPYFVAKEG